ncbi:MAG: tetratricopeptide repeat protein [Candidatus Omnitrophota bacterium]
MKKNVSSILVCVMVLSFMILFSGCESLKTSNLQANYHLKKAHKFYQDEQYRNAAKEYEAALALNPNLKFTYLYIGTSYIQVYRPGKDDPNNKEAGDKAISYLLKAKEYDPNNDKVIIALGDIYDKMGNFEEAKKYYMQILAKSSKKPASYYTLAQFFSRNGKTEDAEKMYLDRIELNPQDPEGYQYYVGFLSDQRRWPDALDNYKKRLYALIDPSIVLTMKEIAQINKDSEEVKKVVQFMDTVKKNKNVDQAEKDRLLAEGQEKLKGKLLPDQATKKLAELNAQLADKVKAAETKINSLDEKTKLAVTDSYYAMGNICWNWSYQTPPDMMATNERNAIIDQGLGYLKKAIDIMPDYAFAYSYIGLLYREKSKIDPLKKDQYLKLNDEYNKKFVDIYTKKKKSEDFKKKLEEMGKQEAGN